MSTIEQFLSALPVGAVVDHGGDQPPAGWAPCDGSVRGKAAHPQLAAALPGVPYFDPAKAGSFDNIFPNADPIAYETIGSTEVVLLRMGTPFNNFSTAVAYRDAPGAAWTFAIGPAQANPQNISLKPAQLGGVMVSVANTSDNIITKTPRGWFQTTVPGITFSAGSFERKVVAAGNGVFVAVGGNGGGVAAVSIDGLAWTLSRSAFEVTNAGPTLTGVDFGNGLFVAVGTGGSIVTSPDGVTWTRRTGPNNTTGLTGVYYDPTLNRWFAYTNTSQLWYSDDTVTWTPATLGGTPAAVVRIGSNLVAMSTGTGVYYSSDGVNWTTVTLAANCAGYRLLNGRLFAIHTSGSYAYSSTTDGVTWTNLTTAAVGANYGNTVDLGYVNGTYLAIASNGPWVSADLVSWSPSAALSTDVGLTLRPQIKHGATGCLLHADGEILVTTNTGYGAWAFDGTDWLARMGAMSTNTLTKVNNTLILSTQVPMLKSTDGKKWVLIGRLNFPVGGNSIASNGTRLVNVRHTNSLIEYSDDEGTTWQASGALPAVPDWAGLPSVQNLVHVNGRFFALCKGSVLAHSADGISWTIATLPAYLETLQNIVYHPSGKWVVFGLTNLRYMTAWSSDLASWSLGQLPDADAASVVAGKVMTQVTVGSVQLVAVPLAAAAGTGSNLPLVSHDGISWTKAMLQPVLATTLLARNGSDYVIGSDLGLWRGPLPYDPTSEFQLPFIPPSPAASGYSTSKIIKLI